MKTEYDYLYGWIKKNSPVVRQKSHPKIVNPRAIAGNAEEDPVSLDQGAPGACPALHRNG